MSGFGGDELFASWRWRARADALSRRHRFVPRDVLRIAYAALPARAHRWRELRTYRLVGLDWLRPGAARSASRLAALARAGQPRAWSGWVDWLARRRSVRAPQWSLSLLAADAGTTLLHPLLDPSFLAALAEGGGRLGFGGRTPAMRALFGELLPDDVLSRPTKARYSEALWGRGTREFAERWDCSGLDETLVSADALRRVWARAGPHEDSALLLHAAWLAREC